MRARYLVTTVALATWSAAAGAQAPDSARATPPAAGAAGQRLRARVQARQGQGRKQPPLRAVTPEQRRQNEQRVRKAFRGVVRRRLNLDDAKMQRLQATDSKFDERRRSVNADERRARLALRAAMADTVHRDQDRISKAIDELIATQRRRTELLEAEQKELSSFLTPMQRAQYLALQEQVARRLSQGAQPPRGASPDPDGPPDSK